MEVVKWRTVAEERGTIYISLAIVCYPKDAMCASVDVRDVHKSLNAHHVAQDRQRHKRYKDSHGATKSSSWSGHKWAIAEEHTSYIYHIDSHLAHTGHGKIRQSIERQKAHGEP